MEVLEDLEAVEEEVQRGELTSLPLGSKKLARTWGISVRKGRKFNKAERMFMQNLQKDLAMGYQFVYSQKEEFQNLVLYYKILKMEHLV